LIKCKKSKHFKGDVIVDSRKDTSTLGCDISQTRVHFVPIKRDCTCETKGAKHIDVLRIKDETNYNGYIIFNKWCNVTFASCVLNDNKPNAPTHE
jgi:hypothetical protein